MAVHHASSNGNDCGYHFRRCQSTLGGHPRITTNNFYGLSVKSTSPSIWSDTIQMTVNVAPTVEIDSIVGGFENLYSGGPDWGMCEGDTVGYLRDKRIG